MDGASGTERLETEIIGDGQTSLAVGYYLARWGPRFVTLDTNGRIGGS